MARIGVLPINVSESSRTTLHTFFFFNMDCGGRYSMLFCFRIVASVDLRHAQRLLCSESLYWDVQQVNRQTDRPIEIHKHGHSIVP
jgi:hypothetical protein